MLYLVQGKVTFTPYMSNSKTKNVIRLVEAIDPAEAKWKFERHYADKSIPNDDSYYAEALEADALIS